LSRSNRLPTPFFGPPLWFLYSQKGRRLVPFPPPSNRFEASRFGASGSELLFKTIRPPTRCCTGLPLPATSPHFLGLGGNGGSLSVEDWACSPLFKPQNRPVFSCLSLDKIPLRCVPFSPLPSFLFFRRVLSHNSGHGLPLFHAEPPSFPFVSVPLSTHFAPFVLPQGWVARGLCRGGGGVPPLIVSMFFWTLPNAALLWIDSAVRP